MLYNRNILKSIDKWLSDDQIIILNGPRQVGKTSLLKLIQSKLKRNNKKIFYFNLEDIDILNDFNASPKNLLKYITDKHKKYYFLIDEIQYLDNPSNFLKYLYDEHKKNIKLIVTGSSSLELKAKFQDSLAGRKITFTVDPLNFKEFLQFQNADILDYYNKKEIPLEIQKKFQNYLDKYLLFGGMPAVALTDNQEKKKELLKNYANDYINKDIRSIGKIDNLLKFNQLVKIIAGQIGSLLNINELSNTLAIPRREIGRYLFLLEQTFVLYKISPYLKNTRSQLIKMPKAYFFDIGIRNQILNNFVDIKNRSDNGSLFENFIFIELKQKISQENIFFYRTTSKTEIDFVFEKNNIVYPIEIKYKNFNKPANIRSLNEFCNSKKINCPLGYVINLNLNAKNNKIQYLDFINFYKKLFQN